MADKALKKSVSMPESLWRYSAKAAQENFAGNMSKFISHTVDQSRHGHGDNSQPIAHLADELLSPLDAIELKAILEERGIDQRRELQRILMDLLSSLQSTGLAAVAEDPAPYGAQPLPARDEALARRIAYLVEPPANPEVDQVIAQIRGESAPPTPTPQSKSAHQP